LTTTPLVGYWIIHWHPTLHLLQSRNRLVKIIESEKRAKILIVQENYVLAEFTSALFRFVDDVEFYFPEKQADDAVIYILDQLPELDIPTLEPTERELSR
jgi:uncharacterized protein (DUF1499 family)